MTKSEELKHLAKRHRWAFEELAYSEKMIEANRIQFCKAYRKLVKHGDEASIEDRLYTKKEKEAVALIQGSTNGLYLYLAERLGSRSNVLGAVRVIVVTQRARRKTLHLYAE